MLNSRKPEPYSAIRSRPMLIFFLCSAVWVLLLYWRALFNPFASYDDLTNIVFNPRLSSWPSVVYYLRTNVSFVDDLRGSGESYYRPFYWVSLALDRKLWGANPAAFHLTSVVLHWLDGCLLFTLLRKFRVPLAVAAGTVLMWQALPINSEIVAWVSARAYLLVPSSCSSARCWHIDSLRKRMRSPSPPMC